MIVESLEVETDEILREAEFSWIDLAYCHCAATEFLDDQQPSLENQFYLCALVLVNKAPGFSLAASEWLKS